MIRLNKLKRNDIIGLSFFVAFVISTSLIYLFEERFDKESWLKQPTERHEMVDDLIESQVLLDKTKDEVIELLGFPDFRISQEKDCFLYKLGITPSFFQSKPEQLLIVFEDEKVFKVSLAIE